MHRAVILYDLMSVYLGPVNTHIHILVYRFSHFFAGSETGIGILCLIIFCHAILYYPVPCRAVPCSGKTILCSLCYVTFRRSWVTPFFVPAFEP